ncbi:MAG: hypothetical protein J6H31_01245 [Butyrivibrio sp.]|nr:hypothetical protein [Butyrivibrio sp.]
MNIRQKNKRNKRKWQQFLSEQFERYLNIKAKPSRIKARMEKTISSVSVIGIYRGLQMEIKFTADNQKSKDENLHEFLENLEDDELFALQRKIREAADEEEEEETGEES